LVGKNAVLPATPLPQSLIIGNGQIDARMGLLKIIELFYGNMLSLKAPKDIIAARCPQMPKWQAACIKWINKCQASFSDCQYFDSQCSDASGSVWAPKLNVDYYDFTKTMDQSIARKDYFIN
jgi:hypothetical protein